MRFLTVLLYSIVFSAGASPMYAGLSQVVLQHSTPKNPTIETFIAQETERRRLIDAAVRNELVASPETLTAHRSMLVDAGQAKGKESAGELVKAWIGWHEQRAHAVNKKLWPSLSSIRQD